MKKEVSSILCLALAGILMLNGCQRKTSLEKKEEAPVSTSQNSGTTGEEKAGTVTDYAGNEFKVGDEINHISCIHPIFTMLGLRLVPDKVVSVDKVFASSYLTDDGKNDVFLSGLSADKVKELPITNTFFMGVDPEQILKLNPDLIVTLDKDFKAKELEEQTKKPMLFVSKNTLEDYSKSMRIFGDVVGASEEAYKMADYWDDALAGMKEKTGSLTDEERPSVYHCSNSSIYATPAKNTIMASVITNAGGKNLGDEITKDNDSTNEAVEVSMEQILKWNPDYIITVNSTQYDEIMSSAEWQKLDAVKNGKVFCQLRYSYVDGLSVIPGMSWMYMVLHGDTDADAKQNWRENTKAFYNLFFKYSMTDKELDMAR